MMAPAQRRCIATRREGADQNTKFSVLLRGPATGPLHLGRRDTKSSTGRVGQCLPSKWCVRAYRSDRRCRRKAHGDSFDAMQESRFAQAQFNSFMAMCLDVTTLRAGS